MIVGKCPASFNLSIRSENDSIFHQDRENRAKEEISKISSVMQIHEEKAASPNLQCN